MKDQLSYDSRIACASCGGIIPANSDECKYCHTRYDRDLRNLQAYTQVRPESGRPCPRCAHEMKGFDLEIGSKFFVERCLQCLGVLFDPLELQTLLSWLADNVHEVHSSRISELLLSSEKPWEKVNYLKCPTCTSHMQRKNYGGRSGVIVDVCVQHATWVDGGELGRLIKWVQLGGAKKDCPLDKERERLKRETEKLKQQRAKFGDPEF